MKTFEELGVNEAIITAIEEQGFEHPMPVQEQVIPHLLNNLEGDILALAQTGTGKTAAFGLPIVQNVDTKSKKIQYLIITPTRELCLQIADDITGYAKYTKGVKIAAVFGGASMDRQIKMIKKGAQIVSATPGRLLDLINRGVINLSKLKTVVLDEADEMLNMGFREDLEEILKITPDEKGTLLFSATMPKEIRRIADNYMKNPIEVTIGKKNVGAETVNHICYMVQARDRYNALKRIVDYHPEIYGIVFCRTRKETQEVAELLIRDGYNADSLHGDLSQQQRDKVMNSFRIKHTRLLVATDVAARGLDIDLLTHIINYNLPDELEIYVHRSGRTGRAGKLGTSIVIANLREKGKLQHIEKMINKNFEYLPVPSGKNICEKQLFHVIDRIEKVEVDYSQIEQFLPMINKKLEWLDREELIKKFVSVEFNRFLEYYKNAPDLNVPNEKRKASRKERIASVSDFTRMFINLGKTDDLTPPQLIGMINDFTNIRNIEIGAIEILKNFSFFEVDSVYTDVVLKSFTGKVRKKREINVEVAEKKKNQSGRRDDNRKRRSPASGQSEIKSDKKKKQNKKRKSSKGSKREKYWTNR